VLPAAALLLILSWGYAIWGAVPWVSAALQGVQPAVVALMGAAVIRLARRWLRSRWHWFMALGTWIGIHQGLPFPLLLLLVFLAGILWRRLMPEAVSSIPAEDPRKLEVLPGTPLPKMRSSVRVFLVCIALWWLPVLLVAFALGARHVLVQEGVFFSGASVVTIGGAYAVLPYVAQQGVERFHWVSGSEMMAGMALAEATPGPLIIVLQFIGFLGAWHHPGSLSPLVAGILGAGITSWTTFFPSFLWIFLGAPWVERLQGLKSWEKWVGVVSAGVVGMILNLAWKLGAATVITAQGTWDGASLVVLAVSFLLLRWGRWPGVAVVVLAAGMGVLRLILGR
jgi:chromate transporter